jgi:hypothetical protein
MSRRLPALSVFVPSLRLAASLVLATPVLTALAAQDPITKPTTGTTSTLVRLPTPLPVVVRQLADGRIQVTWKRLTGATSYALRRSVPPAGIVALAERPTDTVYYDSDVKAGSTYYYNVAGVGSDGMIGLWAGGSVQATLTAGATSTSTTPRAPAPVEVAPAGSLRFLVRWQGSSMASRYEVRRLEFRPSATDSMKPDGGSPLVTTSSVGTREREEFRDSLPPSASARLVAWDVSMYKLLGGYEHAQTPTSSCPRRQRRRPPVRRRPRRRSRRRRPWRPRWM